MIRNLQSLRGIAAILIFYHHYFGLSYRLSSSFGDLGVVFFMMLSGFVISLSTNKKIKAYHRIPSIKRFFIDRLIKIYPLYLICWFIAILVLPYSGSITGKILGIFMLQSWIPIQEIYFSGNAVAWFISDLFLCYLAFIPLIRLIICGNKVICYYVLAFYFATYLSVVWYIPEKYVHAIIYINPIMQLSNFILGMLLCKLYLWANDNGRKKFCSRTSISLIQIVSVTLIIILCYHYKNIPERFSFGLYWWFAISILIFTFSVGDKFNTPLNQLLHCKPIIWIGNMSFIFYLIHYIAVDIWQLYFHSNHITTEFTQSIILILILFGISYVINKTIVIPIINMLKRYNWNL